MPLLPSIYLTHPPPTPPPENKAVVIGLISTGEAVSSRLIQVLNLRIPNDLDRRYGLKDRIPVEDRPIVFVGPYEHHSNEVQWRETIADGSPACVCTVTAAVG